MNGPEIIRLGGGKTEITSRAQDAYRVLCGRVLVYIVPWDGMHPGRRCLLCEAREGDMLPSLACRDLEGQQWRLCFAALEEAELMPCPGENTPELRERFLLSAGVQGGPGSFEDSLIDRCRLLWLREDGGLILRAEEKDDLLRRTDSLIAAAAQGLLPVQQGAKSAAVGRTDLSGRLLPAQQSAKSAPSIPKEMQAPAQENTSDEGANEAYRALALLCRAEKIAIAPWEKVAACLGPDASPMQIARLSGVPCREVLLEENWHTADAGGLLVRWGEEARWAACLPGRRYTLVLPGGQPVRLTKTLAEQAAPRALSVQRPFPEEKMDLRAFGRWCALCLCARDIIPAVLLSLVCAAAALLLPLFAAFMIGLLAPVGRAAPILQTGALAFALLLGSGAFIAVRDRYFLRAQGRLRFAAQCAAYHRAFDLPESAVRGYESTDLARRVLETGLLAGECARCAAGGIPALAAAVAGMAALIVLSPLSALVCAAAGALTAALTLAVAVRQAANRRTVAALDAQTDAALYQFIEGAEKIRTAGAQERAVYEFLKPYARRRQAVSSAIALDALGSAARALPCALALMAVCLSPAAADAGAAAGLICAAFLFFGALHGALGCAAEYLLLGPVKERVGEWLAHAPEKRTSGKAVGKLSGRIDIEHVHFAYPDGTEALCDLSLQIREGEYLGLVGPSGCGKSTLLRLLLGFEQPQRGRILYDGQDMRDIDLSLLRRHFGAVLQEGGLVSGSILDNITLTRPGATLAQAEEAARLAGVLEDILAMPMQFHTRVSESGSTLSGGQAQRILIARAILDSPDILFFDEATSALDNISQRTVCETLEKLPGTKIVIAHRLSTLMHCDRIAVMDGGRIAETGTYDELMARDGLFRALAKGQTA